MDDKLIFEGVVSDSNKGVFSVKISDSYSVLAKLSGKIRINDIKINVGDKVRVEISPYDTSRGRIITRLK